MQNVYIISDVHRILPYFFKDRTILFINIPTLIMAKDSMLASSTNQS